MYELWIENTTGNYISLIFSKLKYFKKFQIKQKRIKNIIGYNNMKCLVPKKAEEKDLLKPFQWMKKWRSQKIHPLSNSR